MTEGALFDVPNFDWLVFLDKDNPGIGGPFFSCDVYRY